MKDFNSGILTFVLILSACGQTVGESTSTPSKIVANNFSDKDWTAGIQTKINHKNMFYFIQDTSATNSLVIGEKLLFAKSGSASVQKVETLLQDGRTAVFVTVDHNLDPVGDGFPNPIMVQ